MRVSEINGSLLETGAECCFLWCWAFAARGSVAKEKILSNGRKGAAAPARDKSVLSISTDSLSVTAEVRWCTKAPFRPCSAPLERDGRGRNLRERETRFKHGSPTGPRSPPSSNKTQTLLSACFSSLLSYSSKPHRLSLCHHHNYSLLCPVIGISMQKSIVYIQDCLWVVVEP
jgi:hypothetical protein